MVVDAREVRNAMSMGVPPACNGVGQRQRRTVIGESTTAGSPPPFASSAPSLQRDHRHSPPLPASR